MRYRDKKRNKADGIFFSVHRMYMLCIVQSWKYFLIKMYVKGHREISTLHYNNFSKYGNTWTKTVHMLLSVIKSSFRIYIVSFG